MVILTNLKHNYYSPTFEVTDTWRLLPPSAELKYIVSRLCTNYHFRNRTNIGDPVIVTLIFTFALA